MEVKARTVAPSWLPAFAVRIGSRPLPYATLALGALSLLIPFVNYGFSGDLTGGDAAVAWALPDEQLRQVLGVYIQGPGLGYNGATGLAAAFPALTLAVLLHALHLSTAIVARLMIALYFFIAMAGARKLFASVLPADRIGAGAAVLAALFYGVNRYTVFLYFTAQTYFPMLYSALPWLVYGVIEGCERRRRIGIVVIACALIWAGGAGSNPALFGVALCAVIAAALFELAQGVAPRRVIAVAGIGTAAGVLCCAWWILPLATSVGAGLAAVSSQSVPSWAQWMSERSGFLNLFKLDGYTGADTLPFAAWYGSPLGSVLGYIPLAVGIAGFGVFRRRFSAALLVAFAVAAFLSKGVHAPFGDVYEAMLDHIPGFSIFRSPFVKWIGLEAIFLSLLFALGLAGVAVRLREFGPRRTQAVAWFAAASAIAVLAYPWVAYAGRMLSPDMSGVGFRSSLPAAYRDVAAILAREAHGARTVVFGGGADPYPLYTWGYFGEDPLWVAVGSPLAPYETLLPEAPQMPGAALASALRSLAVGFIVVHHDVRNVVPSPQVDVLVATGAARSLYRSPVLDLYRLRGPVEPQVQVLPTPLLVQPRDVAAPDDRAFDSSPGQLDPNVGFLIPNDPSPVVASLAGAQPSDFASSRLGWIRDVTDAPAVAPRGAQLAYVPGNPLAVRVQPALCGRNEGVSFDTPVRWTLGRHDLGSLAATLCLSGRRVGQVFVGGNLPNQLASAISLVNGTPLAIDVPEVRAADLSATRLLRSGLPFEVRVPKGSGLLEFILPVSARAVGFSVILRTLQGKLVGVGGPSSAGVVAVRLGEPAPADESLLAYLKGSDAVAYVALQRVRRIPVSTAEPALQRLWLDVDQRLVRSIRLQPADVALGSRPSVAPAARGATFLPALTWLPDTMTPRSAWSTSGAAIRLHSEGPPVELHAAGFIAADSRYRLTLDYRATGFAELWTRTGGAVVDRITHLTADGHWHRFTGRIFPPVGSDGSYIVRMRSSAGVLDFARAKLTIEGPNGVVVAWHKPAPLGGTLVHWERRHPWQFDVDVAGCTPCALRLGVSDPRNWRVRGATIDGTFTSQGASAGPFSAITTGAATWLIDAGAGTRTVTFLYWPALVAAVGLAVSLVSAALTMLLLVMRRSVLGPAVAQPISMAGRTSTPIGVLIALAFVTLVVAALSGFPNVAGPLADGLWVALVLCGLYELVR